LVLVSVLVVCGGEGALSDLLYCDGDLDDDESDLEDDDLRLDPRFAPPLEVSLGRVQPCSLTRMRADVRCAGGGRRTTFGRLCGARWGRAPT
jgi:hypothetical protein